MISAFWIGRRQSAVGPGARSWAVSILVRFARRAWALAGVLGLSMTVRAEPGHVGPEGVAELRVPVAFLSTTGRQFLRYAVSCALPPGRAVRVPAASLNLSDDVFEGAMGLAPDWATRGLMPHEERLVSACLLARTNYFGVPVQLSLRRPNAAPGSSLDADAAERSRYSRMEARFFGNLFQPRQTAYFCRGDEFPDRARWLRSLRRICALEGDAASGVNACGFVDVGPCSAARLQRDGVDYESSAIDVFLPLLADSPVPDEGTSEGKD